MVYDNEVYRRKAGLKSDWGFSCLVETESENILFDTGAKGKILLNNIRNLGIDPKEINKVVVSHEHWDHNGGLKALAPLVDNVKLYRLAEKSPIENMRLIIVKETQEIAEGIYTTGRLRGLVDEQSLVLKGEKGWYVLVGCSHPGVEKILNTAKRYGGIIGVIGGLHGFSDFDLLKDLEFVCPCHCTKHKRKIKEFYPEIYIEGGVGRVIEI